MNSRGRRKGRRPTSSSSARGDGFFEPDRKRRRKSGGGEFVESDDDSDAVDLSADKGGEEEEQDAASAETAAEKRLRIAREHLDRIRAITRREREERGEEREGGEDQDEDHDEEDDGGEREGMRDSMVAEHLHQKQLEESGRVQRPLASRVLEPEVCDKFRIIQRHRQSVTAVALAEDDTRGFSASKDGIILHWDVESGKKEKYLWPSEDVLISHGARAPQNKSLGWSKHVLALAVSSDGRYLSTGGLDRHIHLWDTRTREHVQAFSGHKGPVSCLTFRQGTSQLFSASFDRTIKLWNAEDRCHMDNLFGHQSDVLTIDCLRKERLLTVGRDRTMRLWKVPEESQLVFRAPASSLECCCFISNEEFLSGSDDGSIELWSMLRKKPTCIVKNAHSISVACDDSHTKDNEIISNGVKTENGYLNGVENAECKARSSSSVQSWVSSVTVCRGSDLAASGAANGVVRLWATERETKSIRPLYDLPLAGFINSLAFARSGRFLVAGVGQEPRLGRWGHVSATNGVALYSLRLSEEGVKKWC